MRRVFAYIKYFLFLIFFLVLYFFNNHAVTLSIVIGAVVFPLLLMLLHWYLSDKVSVTMDFSVSPVTRGNQTELILRVKNEVSYAHSHFCVSLKFDNQYEKNEYVHDYELYIAPNKVTEHRIPLRSLACGLVEASLVGIRTTDWLGLYEKKLSVSASAEAIVMPRSISLPEEDANTNRNNSSEECNELQQKGSDPSEIYEVRKYHEGDRIQSIHWKLTAKEQELMVKEFADLAGESYVLWVDRNFLSREHRDALFDLLYSVCGLLGEQHIIFSICWNDASGEVHKRRVLEQSMLKEAIVALYYAGASSDVGGRKTVPDAQTKLRTVWSVTNQHYKQGNNYRLLFNNRGLARIYEYKEN